MPPRCLALLAITLFGPSALAAEPSGAEIYQKKCASCHGANGEGTKKYNKPLTGDRTIPQLAKQVRDTMPEDAPGSLSVADSERVSRFIHETFYSKEARERAKPPRIELARLTVAQYRHALADLVESFRFRGTWDDKRGLKGEYFGSRGFQFNKKGPEKLDPEVAFDFGTALPEGVKSDTQDVSIRWSGGLLAPETGEYQLVVRTDHAFRLFVNDPTKAVLDAWVKSGTDTEFTANVFLVGGRVYPIRFEWTKAKQGVDDSKKNPNPPPKPAFVRLEWKPPHKVREVIPSRYLSPNAFAETFISSTPFPPDDRSYGWERGTSVSKEWDAATTDAALEATGYIAEKLNVLAKTQDTAPDRSAKIIAFCTKFAERAFRRPLTLDQKALYIDQPFAGAKDLELALKKSILMVLKSPRFLYREVVGGNDSYDVAARLSFALWDALPDEELLKLAATGKPFDRATLLAQAERMLKDPRAQHKLRGFLVHWLALDHAPDVMKDMKRFPGFDAPALADLRTSLELFLDGIVFSEKSDYRDLLTAETVPMNGRLAKLYGADLPEKAPFQAVRVHAEKRSGVLTHPYLMAAYAAGSESSPIHRGVFVARGLLGITLKPPPEAVAPVAPDLHPTLNTRERVVLQTKGSTCMTCHGVINPLGFPLEAFDAVGRFREVDNKKPVDATGSYQARDGKTIPFNGAKELGQYLANSPEAQGAFAEQLFHHLAQQSLRAYGAKAPEELLAVFQSQQFSVKKLAAEIAVRVALTPRAR
jgi:hypothetical protein